jgi:hypothetical protein
MDKSEQIMTRYLLGELSESEQAELEEKYFTDPQAFDRLLRAESELVDDYVRGQLSAQARERFEGHYLNHPRRRARVKFAEALATRLDALDAPGKVFAAAGAGVSWRQRLSGALRGQRWAVIALATLLIMLGGIWFFIESRRLRRELAETQAAQEGRQSRERELEQLVAAERRRAEQLREELERAQQTPQTLPTPAVSPSVAPPTQPPTFVSLLLSVGSTRSTDTGPPQTLLIPQGTALARLQIRLKEHDYPGYSLSLRRVGGEEIFSRGKLQPRVANSGASLSVEVPAGKFSTGDYLLTLGGVGQDGTVDELSKIIFRVEKR